jgi:hypothetical protein
LNWACVGGDRIPQVFKMLLEFSMKLLTLLLFHPFIGSGVLVGG